MLRYLKISYFMLSVSVRTVPPVWPTLSSLSIVLGSPWGHPYWHMGCCCLLCDFCWRRTKKTFHKAKNILWNHCNRRGPKEPLIQFNLWHLDLLPMGAEAASAGHKCSCTSVLLFPSFVLASCLCFSSCLYSMQSHSMQIFCCTAQLFIVIQDMKSLSHGPFLEWRLHILF